MSPSTRELIYIRGVSAKEFYLLLYSIALRTLTISILDILRLKWI